MKSNVFFFKMLFPLPPPAIDVALSSETAPETLILGERGRSHSKDYFEIYCHFFLNLLLAGIFFKQGFKGARKSNRNVIRKEAYCSFWQLLSS